MTKVIVTTAVALLLSSFPAAAQSADAALGRLLAETTCNACHQIAPDIPATNPESGAPSFIEVSKMPSTTELSIKVFLRSTHPTMPNIILSPKETNSVAAYIVSLAHK